MPQAARAQTSFLGGIWSGSAQGRFDDPAYATALSVCLNGFPIPAGAWTRRPGTQHTWTTRNAAAGRLFAYAFNGSAPYTVEFTDLFARFRTGAKLATTNDSVAISAISGATPAAMTLATAVTWVTGNQVYFSPLGTIDPQLLNRIFTLTKTDTTHFTLADAITGASLNGALLKAFTTGTVNRVQEVATPYGNGSWANVRIVQADTNAIFLLGSIAPQIMLPTTQPSLTAFAQFSLSSLTFLDGPYLDPVTNGAQLVPTATKGTITLTLQFPAYDAAKAYKVGDFVTSSAVNYQSLTDNNVGNTPVSSPSSWLAVSAGAAINGGLGFLGTDVGRLIRLLYEPALWLVGTTYAAGNVVAYNPTGLPGAATYWTSLVGSNVGKIPGNDTTNWTLTPGNAALWTWGKIVSLGTLISGTLSGSTNIGNLTSGGGLSSVFDGVTNKTTGLCASLLTTGTGFYVGKNYSGASAQQIGSATLYPSTDDGLLTNISSLFVSVALMAKQTLPANAADGTVLNITTPAPGNTSAPISMVSLDQTTAWNYVWFRIIPTAFNTNSDVFVAQAQFFSPPGTGSSGNAVSFEVLGPALLGTTPIITWRFGAFSNTTGWPSCGTWAGGRLWLGGAIQNRVDACVSNGILGTTINFAPTGQDGTVAGNNAISYTFNAPDTSAVEWFSPEQQGIVVGTQSGEWLLFASANNNLLTPISIDARRVTRMGCANIEPRRTEQTVLIVQKRQRMVAEYFADVFSGKYLAADIAKNAKALTQTGIQEIAYQQQIVPILWMRRGDGTLIGCTYRRDSLVSSQGPTFSAMHQHALGSGRTVTSICDAGTADGTLDSVAMVTLDSATGLYHVEIMTNLFEDNTPITSAWFLDDAVQPSYSLNRQTQVLTLSGLWHLNGKTVQAFVQGFDAGDTSGRNAGPWTDFTVTNGAITIAVDGSLNPNLTDAFLAPFVGASTLSVVVGFTYTSQGQLLRLADQKDSGSANGPAFGKMSRNAEYAALLQDTQGISFGSVLTGKVYPANFRTDANVSYPPNQLKTGVHWDTLPGNHSRNDPQLCWQITRPLPATVCAVKTAPDTE